MSEYRLPDGTVPVLLSADSPNLLHAEAKALLSYVSDHPEVPPDRVAAMLFRTRNARRHRALAMVGGRDGLAEALRAVVDGRDHPCVVRGQRAAAPHRHAYVLPGQGGQRPGMGTLFYQTVSAYRAEADRCNELFGEQFGESPRDYLLGTGETGDGTTVVQSALFVQMVGLAAMWRGFGVDANAVVGHSQGEIAGAYLAGKLTLEDAVAIVGIRARAMESISSDDCAMAVIAADRDECESVLARQSGWAQVSVVNSPRLVGISGESATVHATVEVLRASGRFTRVIPVGYPAHTSMVNPFRDAVRAAVRHRVRSTRFLDSAIECIGSTLGEAITSETDLAEYWFWNLRNIVRFDRAVATAVAADVDTFVELAEHPALQLALQENLDVLGADTATVVGTSERQATDLTMFTRNLANVAVDDIDYPWEVLRTESEGAVELPLLDFPNTQMNESMLWLPYRTGDAAQPSAVETPPTRPRPQILVEEWIPLSRRAMSPPRRLGVVEACGGVELAEALCAGAVEQGASARRVTAGDACDDVATLVVLVPEFDPMSQADAVHHVTRFFADRPWWFTPGVALSEYWLVTIGGEKVTAADGPPHPIPAGISAGFRCIGGEYPDIAFRHLDLSAADATPESAQRIVSALHTVDEPELALRDGKLYAKRLTEAADDATPLTLAGRHVLITGGTGAVGTEFCEYAAREGARVTRVSRSGVTPPIAGVRTVACDVADPADVHRLADELRHSPIDLVIHAVMGTSSAAEMALPDLGDAELDNALRGKVVGIEHVVNTVPLAHGCRLLLCSSTASILGGRGKVVYAAANRMLDAYAHHVRASGRECVSVQWGQWAVYRGNDIADIANLAGIGYVPMSSADAIPLGLSELPANAAVAGFDWERAGEAFATLGYGPTLSRLTTPQNTPTVASPTPVAGDVAQRMLRLLADVIGAEDVQALDGTVPLVALGLDSLNALRLRRRVKTEFDGEVAISDLLGGATLDDVVAVVAGT
jgi:mycobactin polyketide synthetase MbtD